MADKIDLSEAIRGVDAIWDNRLAEAEAIFATKKDTNPRYALHYAEIVFLRSFITADANDTTLAVARLKAAQALAEEHCKLYDKGKMEAPDKQTLANRHLDARLALGETLQMNAILKMSRGSKLKGALTMRKSWKVFERTQELFKDTASYHPELVHTMHFGAGLFYFALSVIPSKFLRFAELAGFKADRALGLRYLREVSEQSRLKAAYGMVVLLFNNLLMPRGLADVTKFIVEADAIIKRAVSMYPNGTVFHMMASHCARKQMDLQGGLEYCRAAIEHMGNARSNMYTYELGAVHFMMLDWQHSLDTLTPLLEDASFQVRGLCTLQVGACHAMLGAQPLALAHWKRVPEISKKYSTIDTYVLSLAQRYVANGGHFSAFELLYIRRDLAKMSRVIDNALRLLAECATRAGVLQADGTLVAATESTRIAMPVAAVAAPTPAVIAETGGSSPTTAPKKGLFRALRASMSNAFDSVRSSSPSAYDWTNDNRASYLLLRGAMLKYKTDLGNDEAIKCFQDVVAMSGVLVERWYLPYALYELCESYFYLGKPAQAVESLKRCIALKDYNWEEPLKVRIRVTADQLKRGPGADEVLLTSVGGASAPAIGMEIDDDDGSSAPPPASAPDTPMSLSPSLSATASPVVPPVGDAAKL